MLEGTTPPESPIEQNDTDAQEVAQDLVMQIDQNQTSIDDFIGDSILEKQTVQELMKEAAETEQKPKKKKTAITSIIFLAINIIFMIFIVRNLISSANATDFASVVAAQGDRLWWLVAGVGLLILFFACETFLFYDLIKKTTGKRRLFLSYRLASVGKYYDFITPTQLGGQPSQILRLSKSGVSAGVATSIPIIKLIVYSFVYTIISIILYIFAVPLIPTSSSLQGLLMLFIKVGAAIGLIVTVILTFLYFIIGNGRIIGRSFIQGLVRFGYKLHIVKNYRQTFDKILTQVTEYQSSIKYLNKHKGLLFRMIFLSLVECIAFALIPFCVVMAFSNISFTSIPEALYCMLITMSEYYLCLLVSTCLPLPGGTGTMEICFIFLFSIGSFAVGDNIGWALIMFRLITYYSVIIHGFLHIIAENLTNVIKNKRKTAQKVQKEN